MLRNTHLNFFKCWRKKSSSAHIISLSDYYFSRVYENVCSEPSLVKKLGKDGTVYFQVTAEEVQVMEADSLLDAVCEWLCVRIML